MIRVCKGLARWSLEITGASIVWFNYQSEEKQENLKGIYYFILNSYRSSKFIFKTFKNYKSIIKLKEKQYKQKLEQFHESTASQLYNLCSQNKGIYAKMGEFVSEMNKVLPEIYIKKLQSLKKLEEEQGINYQKVQKVLQVQFQKPIKQVFDAIQPKPLHTGFFSQLHKAVLLENYRQVIVKIKYPFIQSQSEHDIWFINKAKQYIFTKLKDELDQNNRKQIQIVEKIITNVEQKALKELNLQLQLQNAQKNRQNCSSDNSASYIPFYYKAYCNKNILIRQFIEGVHLNDFKQLKILGLTPEMAFNYLLAEVNRQLKKYGTINEELNLKNVIIRKYVKPHKPKIVNQEKDQIIQSKEKKNLKRTIPINHPTHQIVFLNQEHTHLVNNNAVNSFIDFWKDLKKNKQKKIISVVDSFYEKLSDYQNNKFDKNIVLKQEYYVLEPMLRIYESLFNNSKLITKV